MHLHCATYAYIDDIDIFDMDIYDTKRCMYSTNYFKAVKQKCASHFIHIQEPCLAVTNFREQTLSIT